MVRLGLVHDRPNSDAQNRPVVHVFRFEWCTPLDEQTNDVELSPVCRPMKCIHTGSIPSRGINPTIEQIASHFGISIESSTRQSLTERLRLDCEQVLCVPLFD